MINHKLSVVLMDALLIGAKRQGSREKHEIVNWNCP